MTAPKYPEIVVHFDATTPEMRSLVGRVSFEMCRAGLPALEIAEFRRSMDRVMRRDIAELRELHEAVYLAVTDWVTIRCGIGWANSGGGEFVVERVNRVWHLYHLPSFALARIGRDPGTLELVGDDFPTREAALRYVARS